MRIWTPDELTAIGNDQVDAAYQAKYRRYGENYVDSIVAAGAREATLKLVPR